jgi:hypothetical protein
MAATGGSLAVVLAVEFASSLMISSLPIGMATAKSCSLLRPSSRGNRLGNYLLRRRYVLDLPR